MDITLKLEQKSAENYATFHGFVAEDGVSIEDFIIGKLLDRISNDLLEKANRDALASIVPVADVTADLKQTALREQAIALAEAKIEALQVEAIPTNDAVMVKAVK